jgi:hypothetical protein
MIVGGLSQNFEFLLHSLFNYLPGG